MDFFSGGSWGRCPGQMFQIAVLERAVHSTAAHCALPSLTIYRHVVFFQRFKEDHQRRSITAHQSLFTASQALSFLIMHRVSQQNLIPL